MLNKFFSGLAVFLLSTVSVFALPVIASEEDQSFDKNQNISQARNIVITDDTVRPVITAASGIRIHIPESFPVIWDIRVSTIVVYGSAATAGKFASTRPAVTYDAKAKTVIIPVAKDFAAGEQVTVSGLVFYGFYASSVSMRLELVNAAGSALNTDTKTMWVRSSVTGDNQAPFAPQGLTVSQTSDKHVKLTWIDPPDMDTREIQILRGVSPLLVSGTPYASVAAGAQTFVDVDTKLGDNITYILRASDGRNFSELSKEASFTLAEIVAERPTICTMDYNPVCGADGVTYGNACQARAAGVTSFTSGECAPITNLDTGTTDGSGAVNILTADSKARVAGITLSELQNAISRYADLQSSHWSVGFLSRLTRDGVLSGYPDGTIQADRTINRAELAKIATKAFGLFTATETFADVTSEDWFAPFVGAVQRVGAAYTTTSRYGPAAPVSRAEALWVLLKAAGVTSIDAKPTTIAFSDVALDSRYAGAIAYATKNSIVSGYEDGRFGPADTLTRAQVAKIVVLIKQKLDL